MAWLGETLARVCHTSWVKRSVQIQVSGLCRLIAAHLRYYLSAEGHGDCFLISDHYVMQVLLGPLLQHVGARGCCFYQCGW